MRRNKGSNKNKRPFLTEKREEYDLKSSLNRLNQKKDISGGTTISEYESKEFERQPINSISISSNQGETATGLFLQINDSINARYDKLKDDITLVSKWT